MSTNDRRDNMKQEEAKVARDSARVEAARERPQGFGGPRLKLTVAGRIPGYHLFFENDDDGAIEQLLAEGFSFVDAAEVNMQRVTETVVADADVTNRVSRFVGKKADGTPMRAYLLKCPDEVWDERERDRHIQADAWEADIKRRYSKPDRGTYVPRGADSSVDTNYRN